MLQEILSLLFDSDFFQAHPFASIIEVYDSVRPHPARASLAHLFGSAKLLKSSLQANGLLQTADNLPLALCNLPDRVLHVCITLLRSPW